MYNNILSKTSAFETPILVYSENDLISYFDFLKRVLSTNFPGKISVHYALKSCYNFEVLKSLYNQGSGMEVMSELEFHLAKKVGFSGSQIIFNGLGRSEEILAEAIAEGARIIIDSPGDFDKIKKILSKNQKPVSLGVRIKLDVSEFPHSPYSIYSHKLGLKINSGELDNIFSFCQKNKNAKLDLLHAHFTIHEKNPEIYIHALKEIKKICLNLESKYQGINIKSIDIGGGFDSFSKENLNAAQNIFEKIGKTFFNLFPDRELIVEPGRYLTNASGYVIGTVLDVKTDKDSYFIITDATTNVLIPIPTAHYELLSPKSSNHGIKICLADGITSPNNVIIHETYLTELPKIGDRILLGNCGAYTDVLSEFWAFNPFQVAFMDLNGNLIQTRTKMTILEVRQKFLGF